MKSNINYDNMPILQGDYLDNIKKVILKAEDLSNTAFYKDKPQILAKIQYLASQKGICKIELAEIVNYLIDNEKILDIIYEYKGVCNRDILIKVISVFWELESIETLAGEVFVSVSDSEILREPIVLSQEKTIQLVYNGVSINASVVGSSQLYSNIIYLFLPAGIKLTISYASDVKKIDVSGSINTGSSLNILNKIYI